MTDWREFAACKGADPAIFFDEHNPERVREAKAICRQCPVTVDCLLWVDSFDIDNAGIFGGYTPRQRRNLRRTGRYPTHDNRHIGEYE